MPSEEIWQEWKEQANLNRNWLTFTYDKHESHNLRPKLNSQLTHKIERNVPGYLRINLEYLQNCSLILLNSSYIHDNQEILRYLICPSLDFAPLSNNHKNCFYLPQSEANNSKIKFNARATEEFIAIVLYSLPSLSWLLINDQAPLLELSEQNVYELWKYLNGLNKHDLNIFYKLLEVK